MSSSEITNYINRNPVYLGILKYLKENTSDKRVRHSLEVARQAFNLGLRFGIDAAKSLTAGIGHDIAREYDHKRIVDLARHRKKPLSNWELDNPLVLHGWAGAYVLESEFRIKDAEILHAVENHVVPVKNMSSLSKIIYIADFIEPTRKYLKKGFRESVLDLSLKKMFLRVIAEDYYHILKKGRSWPETAFFNFMDVMDKP